MTDPIIIRPALSARVPTGQSRTVAFADRFGGLGQGAVVELRLPTSPSPAQRMLSEILVDLCLRMDPIVSEIRISSGSPVVSAIVDAAAQRFPLEHRGGPLVELDVVRFAVGRSELPYVDASDWLVGFNVPVGGGTGGDHPGGAFIGALEAAKYLFLRAAAIAYNRGADTPSWGEERVFDAWSWTWSARDGEPRTARLPSAAPTIALVGCGGVGAAYLWFLRKTRFSGALLLLDDDIIEWSNMNRLFYATVQDADDQRPKVLSAAAYMNDGWSVRALARKAEHPEAAAALTECARAGGLLASAVGEPETRKFLGRRGFAAFFDAGTNSDGWARALALRPGQSRCSECEVQARAAQRPGGCGQASTEVFAGVVPHLAAYAGVLLALEHVRVLLGAPVLGGSNTQSIMMDLEAATRICSRRCPTCPTLPAAEPAA